MKTVVFDLGGVLIDWNPRYLYRKIFNGDETKVEWFLSNVCTHKWNEQHDMGVSFEENARLLLQQHPEYATEIRAYKERWAEMFGGAIEESVEILRSVKASGVSVYALTNWSAETFPRARQIFPFLSWFEGIVVSGELGIKKPDVRIYEHLIRTHNIRPESSVYIDDVLENVVAARALGFSSIHFKNPKELRGDLAKLISSVVESP